MSNVAHKQLKKYDIFYSPIDRPASVAGVKLRLNTCESIMSADKHRLNIGLTLSIEE
mgnify:CR=1 FL=1